MEINGLLKWEKSRSISELFSVSESIKNKDISPRNASTKHFLLIHPEMFEQLQRTK